LERAWESFTTCSACGDGGGHMDADAGAASKSANAATTAMSLTPESYFLPMDSI
jgi:hypothetical protein